MTNLERIKQKLDELGRDEITHSEVRELVEGYEKAVAALKIHAKYHDDSGIGGCMAGMIKDAKCTCAASIAHEALKELGEL